MTSVKRITFSRPSESRKRKAKEIKNVIPLRYVSQKFQAENVFYKFRSKSEKNVPKSSTQSNKASFD